MPLFLGQLVSDRYRIDALIQEDSAGALYQAWDMRLKAMVVFLENRDSSDEAGQRFNRDAELLTHINHSNLPRIIDHFTLPAQGQYLVMDQVAGDDLQTRLDQAGVLPQAQVLDWLAQVSEALAYLRHREGTRLLPTLTPADIVIDDNNQVTLMGFEVLKRHMPGKLFNPQSGPLAAGYSAPELYAHHQPDERSDVYSLGALLYYALTSQSPPESIHLATGSARLMPVTELNPNVSPGVQQLILKATAPDASRRFQNLETFEHAVRSQKLEPALPAAAAAELAEIAELTEINDEPESPTPPPMVETRPAPGAGARLWPVLLAGLGFVLGAILVSVIYFSFLGSGTQAGAGQNGEDAQGAVWRTPTSAASGGAGATAELVDFPTPTPEPLAIEAAEDSPLGAASVEVVDTINDPLTNVPMVLVPGGPFIMGGPSGGEDAQPDREVTLDGFFIDQYEVTNGQYLACVEAGACQPPANIASYTRDSYFGNPAFATYPVLQVSWNQAFAFCAWRGARLPTEAQWEKAARGTDARLYPWGEGLDCSLANWATSSGACVGDTVEVGSYPQGASSYGVLDMAGNVWEWVADWYAADYYAAAPAENPPGPDSGALKVLRGGSWVSNETNMRAAFRNNLEPASTSSNIGFRCVRPVEP